MSVLFSSPPAASSATDPPLVLASGDTFTVLTNTQKLWATTIKVSGTIRLEGTGQLRQVG